MKLQGRAVFPGNVRGTFYFWGAEGRPSSEDIIVASFLTNEVAFAAVNYRVAGIVTEEGSFATHGANLLRSAWSLQQFLPVWITGVKDALQKLRPFSKGQILPDGTVLCDELMDGIGEQSIADQYFVAPPPEIVRLETRTGKLYRAYWPHRHYDLLTATVMIPGLLDCCLSLTGNDCVIQQDQHGVLWFSSSAPSVANIKDIAISGLASRPYFYRQVQVYEEIMRALRPEKNSSSGTKLSLHHIFACIVRYFSVFLLYHNTYEEVLSRLAILLDQYIDTHLAGDVMNRLLRSQLTDWLLSTQLILANAKDLLTARDVVPVPPFSIVADLDSARASVNDLLNEQELISQRAIRAEDREYVIYASQVFVVKEWKFAMNKLLFSRFAFKAREHAIMMPRGSALSDINNWRHYDINSVLEELNEL